MQKSIKFATVALALSATLLLSGCSSASPTADTSVTLPPTASASPTTPSGLQSSTTEDTPAVTKVFEEFMSAAFTLDQDARTEVFASFQMYEGWTEADMEKALLSIEELMPELALIDSSSVTLEEKAEAYFSVMAYSSGTSNGIQFDIAEDAITFNEDQALIDLSKVSALIDGENVPADYLLEISSRTIELVNVDGKWLLSARSLIAEV